MRCSQEQRKQKHDAGMEPNTVFSWIARGDEPNAFELISLIFMVRRFQRHRFPGRCDGHDNDRFVYVNMTYTKNNPIRTNMSWAPDRLNAKRQYAVPLLVSPQPTFPIHQHPLLDVLWCSVATTNLFHSSPLLSVRRKPHAFGQQWHVRDLVANRFNDNELDVVRLA